MLIDIHNHLVYGMDDGPESLSESIRLVKEAADDCITHIVCTPHKRYGMFEHDKEAMDARLEEIRAAATEYGVTLYPGCEYHVGSDIFDDISNKTFHTLGDGKWILCEYSHDTEYERIEKYTKDLISRGYRPVIAHAERYRCFQKDFEKCAEIRKMGALIQINAGSVLGIEGRDEKKLTKCLLKNEIADIIASDAHGTDYRRNHLAECFRYVKYKYSDEYAEVLFCINPGKVIGIG